MHSYMEKTIRKPTLFPFRRIMHHTMEHDVDVDAGRSGSRGTSHTFVISSQEQNTNDVSPSLDDDENEKEEMDVSLEESSASTSVDDGYGASSMSLQIPSGDFSERMSFTSSELKTPPSPVDQPEDDDIPQIRSDTFTVDSPRHTSVPTPVDIHIRDLVKPVDDYTHVQNIAEKKYPVLPSIGQVSDFDTESLKRENTFERTNLNQLDYTREKMESEADFFSDYRYNTSKVKATPRQHPLPPIRQGSMAGGLASTKR